MMSNTATNYNVNHLHIGMAAAGLALLGAFIISLPVLREARLTGLLFVSVALAYGGMMFASSYVEEEQQFWYWAVTGWLLWLSLKQ